MTIERIGTVDSCACSACCSACRRKPGWFVPEEIAPLAEAMGLTPQQLFDRHLAVDWWEGDDANVFVLSPAIKGEPTGDMFPGDPRGECAFFKDERCTIHDHGKPFECRKTWHLNDGRALHKRTADAWNAPQHQQMIRDLLGREPVAEEYEGDGLFSMLGLLS